MTIAALPSNPDPDRSLLGTLDRALSGLENVLNILAALTIFLVMLATVFQIGARLSGHPIKGFLELSEQSIAIFAFLGAAFAQRLGGHIRMELLVGAVKKRGRWVMEALSTLVGLCVVGALITYSFWFFWDAYTLGDTTLDYGYPTWPSKILVPIALSVWFLRLSLEFCGFVRLAVNPDLSPVAVPIIKSAADVAQDEAIETFGLNDKAGPEARQ